MRARIFSRFSDCSSRVNWSSKFVQHVFHCRRVYSRRSDFHGHAARAKGLGLKSIVLQFVGDFGEHRLLRGRQLQHNRHQQALAFDSVRRPLLQHSFKQHALVGHVLVHNPQTIFVHRQDERIANLPQRLERAQRSQRRLLFAHVESRSTPMIRNRFNASRANEIAAFASTAIPPSN